MIKLRIAVQACMLAISNENAVGEVFNIAGEDSVTPNEFYAFIAKNVGAEMPKRVSVEQALADGWGENYIKLVTAHSVIDISKPKKMLGFKPKYNNPIEGVKQSCFSEK